MKAKPVALRRLGAGDAALAATALASALGLVRLGASPWNVRVLMPVVVVTISGQLATAVVARRLGRFAGGGAGALTVVAASTWWFVPSSTTWGVPTASTGHAVRHVLGDAWRVIRTQPTPVSSTTGIVMCMAVVAGASAVIGQALRGPSPRPAALPRLVALVPSAALVVYSSLLSSDVGRVEVITAYLFCVGLFVAVADRQPAVWAPVTGRRRWPALLATLAAALTVEAAASPAFAGWQVHAFPAPPGLTLASQPLSFPRGIPNLFATVDSTAELRNLGALLTTQRNQLLFVARTEEPTYWQVASLTGFDGASWTPDPVTLSALQGAGTGGARPPVLAQPRPQSTFEAAVYIYNLDTGLLPAPPGTISVRGPGARIEPGIGVTLSLGSPGSSRFLVQAPATPALASAWSRVGPSNALAPYLSVPPEPSDVVGQARRIVAGARTPLAAALRLADWFRSGRFHYSLTAHDVGPNALERFLFHTRAGFCQQFAGAYGVLARIVGLPTRLAVGYTPGTRQPDGSYDVKGADAHVWPQVYLGPGTGWVSFEPTPGTTGAAGAVGILAGSGGQGSGATSSPSATTSQGAANGGFAPHGVRGTTGGTTAKTSGQKRPSGGGSGGPSVGPWWLWLVVALAAASAAAALARWRGDLTDRLGARAGDPPQSIVHSWRQTSRALARRHLARRADETLFEHAQRVARHLGDGSRQYAELAALAERVAYSSGPFEASDAATARALRSEVLSRLRPVRLPRRASADRLTP